MAYSDTDWSRDPVCGYSRKTARSIWLDEMEADRDLTQLIGDIYDAALDSSRWTDVLATIAKYTGGQAAGLSSKEAVNKSGNIYYQFGVDPYFVQLYSETSWKFGGEFG